MNAFDQLEQRVNRAVMGKLANAVAVIGDRAVPAIFQSRYAVGAVGSLGMAGNEPHVVLANADIPADFIDSEIVVCGMRWTVVDTKPDDARPESLTVVVLERA